jgi:hypothetical protein
VPGANATIPREPSLERILYAVMGRLRRLETNHKFPNAGTAAYGATYSLSAAALWTPDFTGATAVQADQIGLMPDGGGLQIPDGWIAWVSVAFTLTCTDPPTGESINWLVEVGSNTVVERADVMQDGEFTYSALAVAPAGLSGTTLMQLGGMASAFGTEFTPVNMSMTVVAIQLVQGGWPTGGGE